MKKPYKVEQLVDQRNALTLYLEALLNEVEVEDEAAAFSIPSVDADPQPPLGTGASQETIGTVESAPQSPPDTKTSAAPLSVLETAGFTGTVSDSEQTKQHEAPEWAIPRFQVLTFSLGNMQMAASLDKLNGIIPLPERLTVLPGQSPWFLGLARNRNQNVQVIDLANVIQPHSRLRSNEENAASTRYILLMDEGRWGVLCNTISTVLTLEPEQVQWQRSPHVDFILGTVIDHMHSVLCIDRLIARLNSGHLV